MWHEKYADEGLTIIGVHTPEFEFEKDIENVKRAVEKFDVEYPVVLDNDFSTWRSYRNRFWPRKYLIDIDGFIVYDHIGEGAYEETEAKIVELLNEKREREDKSDMLALDTETPEGAERQVSGKERTPEIYFGHSRLKNLANAPSDECIGSICDYVLPKEIPLNLFALGGLWNIGEERAVLMGEAGSIVLGFSANTVNIVAEGLRGPVNAKIYLEGIVSGDQIFRENVTLDGLDWPEFSAIINTGSGKNVLVGLTVPGSWTGFGIKEGNLTFWATTNQ